MTLFLYLFMIKLKMKKVKTFLHIFFNSLIPNTSYYRKILPTHFRFSFKYFFSLIMLLNLILIFNLINKYSPPKIFYWLNEINKTIDKFPEDLNIFINNGFLTTTHNRPYFIWMKNNKNQLRLMLVIDESASLEKINQYQSPILLTKTDLLIKQNNKIERIPLTSFDKTTINKESLLPLKQQILTFKNFFYYFYFAAVILAITLIPISSLIVNIFYLSFGSLIAFILLKLKSQKKYHFKKIFQISLHASTLPLLINYLAFNFPLSKLINVQFAIPFISPTIVFIFLLAVFIFIGAHKAYYDHNHNHHNHHKHHPPKNHKKTHPH